MNQQAENSAQQHWSLATNKAQHYYTSSAYIVGKQIPQTWHSFTAHLNKYTQESKQQKNLWLQINNEQTYLQAPNKEYHITQKYENRKKNLQN